MSLRPGEGPAVGKSTAVLLLSVESEPLSNGAMQGHDTEDPIG